MKFWLLEKNQPSADTGSKQAVHVMGEMTFVYQFVHLMTEQGVLCVASTTKRIVTNQANNTKTAKFEFIQFREYTQELF